MRTFLITLVGCIILGINTTFAGLKWIEVGVNGLTCSACSRSVEMSLRKVNFVDSVAMSLEETQGRIYLNNREPLSLKRITKAVIDAGFSVRFIRMVFDMRDISVSNDGFFTYQYQQYQCLNASNGILKDVVSFKLIDDDFLSRKESAEWKKKYDLSKKPTQQLLHVILEG